MPNRPTYTPRPEQVRKAVQRQAVRIHPTNLEWQAAFTEAVVAGQSGRPALFWLNNPPSSRPFPRTSLAPWQPDWVDVLTDPERTAGQHILHAEGAYYLLDFSSILSASVLLSITSPVDTILDLCSAPGGKGIFAWRCFHPELLVCNEVIAKRSGPLIANLKRCHIENSIVTRLDPSVLVSLSRQRFNLVLVDAPCSGQSLPAKGDLAPGAYQPNMISMNMTRQRRILANAIQTVAPGGHLVYMTCTYSREENEKNVEWLLRRFPEFEAIEVPHLADFRSWLADFPCYRHSPQDGFGVGGFTALLKRNGDGTSWPLETHTLRPVWQYQA